MHIEITLPKEFNPDLFPTGKGITVSGQVVKFEGFTADAVEDITRRFWRKSMPDGSNVTRKTLSKSKSLSSDEIEAVKQYLPDEYDPKRDHIYKIGAANTKMDRDYDRFTPNYLKAMADGVKNHRAKLLFNHDNSWVIGDVFHAEVKQMGGADMAETELVEYIRVNGKATLPGQANNDIVTNMEGGFITDASVRFSRWKSEIKEIGGKYVRIIDVPENGDEVIHSETSLVTFPAQYNTGLKMFSPNGKDFEEFSIKSFDLKTVSQKPKLAMAKIEHEFKSAGNPMKIVAELDGDTGKFSGVADVQKAFDGLEASLKAVSEAYAADKLPYINSIQNLEGEKGLKKAAPRKEDELKLKSITELTAIEKDLMRELKAVHPTNQLVNAVPAEIEGGEKKEETKSYRF